MASRRPRRRLRAPLPRRTEALRSLSRHLRVRPAGDHTHPASAPRSGDAHLHGRAARLGTVAAGAGASDAAAPEAAAALSALSRHYRAAQERADSFASVLLAA